MSRSHPLLAALLAVLAAGAAAPTSLGAQVRNIPSGILKRAGGLDLRPLEDVAPLSRDTAFQNFLVADTALTVPSGSAAALLTTDLPVESFTTSRTLPEVKVLLESQLPEPMRTEDVIPDVDVRDFAADASDDRIQKLGFAVLGQYSPADFRAGVARAFRKPLPPRGRRATGFIKSAEGGDIRIEVQRPYLDFAALEWVDATRIRLVAPPEVDRASGDSTPAAEPPRNPSGARP